MTDRNRPQQSAVVVFLLKAEDVSVFIRIRVMEMETDL